MHCGPVCLSRTGEILTPTVLQALQLQIDEVLRDKDSVVKKTDQRNVFEALLQSDLPPEEVSRQRLHHEATLVVGAGFETTKYTLALSSFHIFSNPHIWKTLRQELETAIPDPANPPSLTDLEKLPYLSACIQESTSTHHLYNNQ